MKKIKKRSLNKFFSTPFRGFASLLVIAVIVLAVLELTNTTHIFHSQKPASETVVTAGKPTGTPEPNVSSKSPAPKKEPSSNNASREGSATDTKGQSVTTTNSSQWTVSKSGNITVKQPTANSNLQNGSIISGLSKEGTVHYRLIDNDIGVIANGTLSVVNGKFSGEMHFTPHSKNGRLDIFNTDSQGVELNEVQIYVNF